ncbi:hypothetical protein [Nesterenkonia flava]|uniref:Uncharacterized protein n=1 Tax=Nesterenkonia flava TaxID=469799 RepID=A0ABU1FWA8_9MICC|nr:hypothetical protein [Nesterenkonia flava]MDR5712970.1 hypothetical protein [Nesterenkonia flava]
MPATARGLLVLGAGLAALFLVLWLVAGIRPPLLAFVLGVLVVVTLLVLLWRAYRGSLGRGAGSAGRLDQ